MDGGFDVDTDDVVVDIVVVGVMVAVEGLAPEVVVEVEAVVEEEHVWPSLPGSSPFNASCLSAATADWNPAL